ncbi:MAG: hypothetical protein IPP74_00640 [Alphaproteobacteria bacterium]|nr:hypothetical protein [Alphaproteobacteria bacterium]
MLKKIIIMSLIPAVMLSACADPVIIHYGVTGPLACSHIETELQSARLALKESKREDSFKLQYILIVPAVVSIYRMNKAETAARKRIDELEGLYQRQACNSQNSGIPTPRSPYGTQGTNQPTMMEPQSLAPMAPPTPVMPAFPNSPDQPGMGQPAMPSNQSPQMPWLNQQQPGGMPMQQQGMVAPGGYPNNGQYNQQLLQQPHVMQQTPNPIPLWQRPQFDTY